MAAAGSGGPIAGSPIALSNTVEPCVQLPPSSVAAHSFSPAIQVSTAVVAGDGGAETFWRRPSRPSSVRKAAPPQLASKVSAAIAAAGYVQTPAASPVAPPLPTFSRPVPSSVMANAIGRPAASTSTSPALNCATQPPADWYSVILFERGNTCPS